MTTEQKSKTRLLGKSRIRWKDIIDRNTVRLNRKHWKGLLVEYFKIIKLRKKNYRYAKREIY